MRVPPVPDVVLAADVGGTFTKLALVTGDGTVTEECSVATERSVDQLVDQLIDFRGDRPVRAFGVVVPGIVDAPAGVVRVAANLGWYDVALHARLTAGLGLPGAIGHDVRSAGLAEWRLGFPGAVSDLLFLALGTGIAGAMVVDGRLLQAGGYAGELGHVAVPAAGDTPCPCGRRGCLETVASASGLARTYARLAPPAPGGPASAAEVAELARRGDPAADRAFELVVTALSEALTAYVTLVGPEVIVLGGGLSGAADLLVPGLEREFARLTFQRRPRVVPAALGSRAGVVGAGLIGADALGWDAPGAGAPAR